MKNLILIFSMVFSLNAIAAQNAKVVVDNASVLDKPQPDGAVVGTVPKDTTIAVSNVPTNGYFKSRIPSGAIGWISGNDLLTTAAPASNTIKPESTPAPSAENTPPKRAEKKKKEISNDRADHSRIIISGGLQILNNSGFPSGISNENSKNGFGGTIEMQFKINEMFYWAGRAEYFTSSSAQTISSTQTQTLSFHTIPVMGGIIYVPVSKPDFRFGLGLYGGISLATSLAVAQSTTLVSGTATYTSSDPTFYGNLQGSFSVSSSLSIYAEGGYRIHSGSYPESPASNGLGVSAFKANFGGIVARLGVEFRL